jgi:hypothetical protein
LCGDFRGLNKKLLIERFGIPLIKDILTALSGKVVFSELDLRQAYLQFDVAEEDRIKLTFRFDGKCYRWMRGIFGLAMQPLRPLPTRHIIIVYGSRGCESVLR